MKNLSLNSRMMIYSIIMVIIVVSILTSVLLYYHKKYIWEEFDQRKLSLASALSQDLELLVLLEDKSGIERMLEGTLKVKDVIYSAIRHFGLTGAGITRLSRNANPKLCLSHRVP